ncbi:MAG: diguanylate cyclase [Lachnospiraceae bacterium]|nr:diguanylate cyclase [Lachnospiraceae bacterium]
MKNSDFKGYKLFKLIQLIVLIIFAVTFFCYLYFDPLLRNNIYSNKSLLTVCIFLWAFMVYSAINMILDFNQLEKHMVASHTLSQTAYFDKLTQLPNRNTLDLLIEKYENTDISEFACALITITNLGQINQKGGRDSGNETLREFSMVFEKVGTEYGFYGRNGGNEFVIVMEDCNFDKMQKFVDDISNAITQYNLKHEDLSLKLSFKYALNIEEKVNTLPELIARMYSDKKRG